MIPPRFKIASYVKNYFEQKENSLFSVHSIFKNAVNYSDGDSLLSITNSTIPISPTSIRVDEPHFYENLFNHAKSGIKMNLNYPILQIKDSQISILDAEVINTRLESLSLPSYNRVEMFADEVYKQCQTSKGIIQLFHKYEGNNTVLKKIGEIIASLRESIISDNPTNFELYLGKLLGLGSGLTPSGDDFIYGYYAALRTYDIRPEYSKRIEYVIDVGKGKVGDISMSFLKALRLGHIYLPLKQLFQSLSADNNIVHPITAMMNYGSTSGCDMLAGVLFAFESN